MEEEIEVLKSIYGNDFIEAPKVWNCPSFFISCKSTANHSKLQARIKFVLPTSYPRSPPTIEIHDPVGLSKKELQELRDLLESEAKQKIGDVMCYDIASVCTLFLEAHVPKAGTLYEDMISRQDRERTALQKIVTQHDSSSLSTMGATAVDMSTKLAKQETSLTSAVATTQAGPRRNRSNTISDSESESDADEQLSSTSSSNESNSAGSGGSDDGSSESDSLSKSDSDSDSDAEYRNSGQKPKSLHHLAQGQETMVIQPIIRSRYNEEFEQIGLLGKGGFGDVWSCRNKLDTRIYAIKKIVIRNSNVVMNAKIRREVTTISRLLHKNIVRYYAAWVEEVTRNGESIEQSSDDESDSANESLTATGSGWMDEDDSVSEDSFSDTDAAGSKLLGGDKRLPKQILYIQMEFCQTTLRVVIDEGNLWTQSSECARLLRQILEALEYIHRQGIIHRDLKPANIFLDSKKNIKIGDFGLATTAKINHDEEISGDTPLQLESISQQESLSGGVGTAAYRAPELDNPNEAVTYDGSADMYSIGIILFEMCNRLFGTGMERFITLRDLKERNCFPSNFMEGSAAQHFHDVILKLTHKDPQLRYTAGALLRSNIFPSRLETDSAYLAEISSSLLRPNSDAAVEILSLLFRQPASGTQEEINTIASNFDADIFGETRDYCESDKNFERELFEFRHRKGSLPFMPAHNSYFQIQNTICNKLEHIFQSFGAVSFSPPALQFRPPSEEADSHGAKISVSEQLEVELLDRSGSVVSLPYNLTAPFARYAAMLNITNCRRYQISSVFLSNDISSRGNPRHPRQLAEAVFEVIDQVSASAGSMVYRTVNANLAALCCAVNVLNTLRMKGMPLFAVRITDSRILTALLIVVFSEFSFDAQSTKPKPSGRKVSTLEQKRGTPSGTSHISLEEMLCNCPEADNILRSLSLTADASSTTSCTKIWDKSNLGDMARGASDIGKRMQPFIGVLGGQCSCKEGAWVAKSTSETLDALEKEFFKCDPIVSMQRFLSHVAAQPDNSSNPSLLEEVGRLQKATLLFHEAVSELRCTLSNFDAICPGYPEAIFGLSSNPVLVLVDLGLRASQPTRLGPSPYNRDGFYFQVEAFKSIEGISRQVIGQVEAATGPMEGPVTHVPVLKRYKRVTGVIIEGGQFNDLLASQSSHVNRGKIIACGFRVRLDIVFALHYKLNIERSAIMNVRNFKKEPGFGVDNAPVVLVLQASSRFQRELYFGRSVMSILRLCRSAGLVGVDSLHQLQGVHSIQSCAADSSLSRYTSPSLYPLELTAKDAFELCRAYGVPILITVPEDGQTESTLNEAGFTDSLSLQIYFSDKRLKESLTVEVNDLLSTIYAYFASLGSNRLAKYGQYLPANGSAQSSIFNSPITRRPSNSRPINPSTIGIRRLKQEGAAELRSSKDDLLSLDQSTASASAKPSGVETTAARDVLVVIVELPAAGRSFGQKEAGTKDWKQTKLRSLCDLRISGYMQNLLMSPNIHVSVRASGTGALFKSSSVHNPSVVAVDMPYMILREFGTTVMKSCSIFNINSKPTFGAAAEELQKIFMLHANPAINKKYLRQLLMELTVSTTSAASAGELICGTGNSTIQTPNASKISITCNLFMYSIPDDKFDTITYCPDVLTFIVATARL